MNQPRDLDAPARRACRVLVEGARGGDLDWVRERLVASRGLRFDVIAAGSETHDDDPDAPASADVVLLLHYGTSTERPVELPQLHRPGGGPPLVVVGEADDELLAVQILGAGAHAYLTRDEASTRLLGTTVLSAVMSRRAATQSAESGERDGRLATKDPLTALANRHLFHDRVEQALGATRRTGQKMAVLILDLDNFKLVNKAMGHAAGDDLLKIVARSLSNCLRETDTAARLGGDEFGVLLTNLQDELDAGGIATKIVDTLSRPLPVQGRAVHCSLSIGIATVPRNGDDSKDLLQQADTAMRHAKKQGRNRIEFFAEEMNTLARRRVKLESGLRTAASDGTLQLHYQPIFDLRRGRMTGAEALIRWRHAELGALAPDEFLPLAEGTDLILEIGDWVLHTACQQAVRWQRMGHEGFRMAVNISPRQLQDPGFCDKIQRALLQSGLQAESLELEITERMLVGDAEDMLRALHEVKELGVHLSVDDFGTGYSALAYLKDLPIDVLKIDRSFTNSLMIDPAGATIVETIVRMAKGLNLTTVAEGVEQPDELLLLGSYGCNRIQGFLVGRPVAASDFAHWIDSPTLRWDHALTDDGE